MFTVYGKHLTDPTDGVLPFGKAHFTIGEKAIGTRPMRSFFRNRLLVKVVYHHKADGEQFFDDQLTNALLLKVTS